MRETAETVQWGTSEGRILFAILIAVLGRA